MVQFNYLIKDPMGLHARPAGLMVKAINKAPCEITISFKDKTVDGKRLYAVLSLGAKTFDTITITCNGENEKQTADLIKELFEKENL